MDLLIENKTAVVTGGDSGIGLATAKFLAQEGVTIVLTDRSKEKLDKAVVEVQKRTKADNEVTAISADLAHIDEVQELAAAVKEKFGGADILVNSAGISGASGDFLSLSDEDWFNTIDVDLMAAVRVCRAFIPQMMHKGSGRIVLIASENALQPYENESPYNACKAAIVNLAKCLSKAYSPSGIQVNCVSPAFIATPMTDTMMEKLSKKMNISNEEAIRWFLENKRPGISEGRRGTAEEVAGVIGFLCSDHASFITGSNYRVDGGSVMTAFG